MVASTLLKVGGSLLGKLLGGKSKTRSHINFKKLRDDARAAGFNPLTALRATGGAGHSVTSGPDMSSQAFIQDAISDGVDAWTNREAAQLDKEYQELRNEQMKLENQQLAKESAPTNVFREYGFGIQEITDKLNNGGLEEYQWPQMAEPGRITVTNPRVLTGGSVDPSIADAEVWETRYGEPGGFVGGLAVAGRDYVKTLKKELSEYRLPKGSPLLKWRKYMKGKPQPPQMSYGEWSKIMSKRNWTVQ